MLGNHKARKRFGQNFLVDQGIISHIVRSIHPQPQDNLIEIGPGRGALTEPLLAYASKLQVIELDRDLAPVLREQFKDYADFTVHQADALTFDFSQLGSPEHPLRIVGNLPYNISTPLIFHLLTFSDSLRDMHFMLQKEVVARMASKPGHKSYGRLSVMSQYACQVEHLFDVGPESFDPAPKVDSAIVRLTPHRVLPATATNPEQFNLLVKTAFGQRRKTLRNSISSMASPEQLAAAEIDAGLRPEDLSVQDYVKLANLIDST